MISQAASLSPTSASPASFSKEIRQQYVYYDNKHYLESPKTEKSTRDIPINPEHAELLFKHLEKLEDVKTYNPHYQDLKLAFPSFNGTPMTPRNLRRTKTEITLKADIPDIGLHTMRKIYCTLLTKALVENKSWSPKIIMELMGHSSPDIAMRTYAQVIEEDKAAAVVVL